MSFRPLTFAALAVLVPLLAACGGSGSPPPRSVSSKPAVNRASPPRTSATPQLATRPAIRRTPPSATVLSAPGLDGVIGASAVELTRQFGNARIDVWEGDARKLQFTGTACVLDIYLYPPAEGRDPRATYVDARRTDGRDVDRAACVAALRTPGNAATAPASPPR